MPLDGYDFGDSLIRDMVSLHHTPCERFLTDAQGTRLLSVDCDRCGSPWPCPQITAYRQWTTANPV